MIELVVNKNKDSKIIAAIENGKLVEICIASINSLPNSLLKK